MDNTENTETTSLAESEEVDNGLDFSLDASIGEEEELAEVSQKQETEPETEPEREEYKLDLSELDSEDMPYAGILTEEAKAAGLKAKEASKFIVGFTKKLHEYHADLAAKEGQALKKEWGKEFQAKRKQTAEFMGKLFARAGLTDEERAMFQNAPMFRAMRKIMGTMGEKKATVGNAAPQKVLSKQEQINERIVRLTALQEDPNTHRAEIAKLRGEINSIAKMILV